MILDDTLYSPQFRDLLKEEGRIIVNSRTAIEGAITVDAEKISSGYRLPTVNTVMLGYLIGISGIVSAEEASEAVKGYMPAKIQEKNISAILQAAEEVLR